MPDYSILQNLQQKQGPKTHPILQAIMNMQGAMQQRRVDEEQSAIRKAQQELLGIQRDTAKQELDYMPQKQQMEQEQHLANLEQLRTNAASTRQSISNQKLQQEIARNEAIYKMTGALNTLPEEVQAKVYPVMRQHAIKAGYASDKDLPATYDENAKNLIINAGAQSGQFLAQLKAQSNQKPIKVLDPNTGKPIYVSENEAIKNRMAPAENTSQNLYQKTQIAAIPTYLKGLTEKTQAGTELINNVNAFTGAAKDIPLGTGLVGGFLAPTSSSGRKALANQGDLTASLLKTYGSNPTEGERAAARERIPTVYDSKKARELKVEEMRARGVDSQEHLKFAQYLLNQGILDPTEIETQWTTYRQQYPIINDKTGRVNTNNLTNWQEYLKGDVNKSSKSNQYSQADIEFTAKKYGLTTEQVKEKLGIK